MFVYLDSFLFSLSSLRLRSVDSALQLLSLYHNGVKAEKQWVQQMVTKTKAQPPLTSNIEEVKNLLDPTMVRTFLSQRHSYLSYYFNSYIIINCLSLYLSFSPQFSLPSIWFLLSLSFWFTLFPGFLVFGCKKIKIKKNSLKVSVSLLLC